MRKRLFLYLLSPLMIHSAFGQDIHFSQYFVAPQLLNPSAFGALNSFEAGMQYKGQWNSFTNGYTSMAAFVNKSFRSKKDQDADKAYLSAGLNVIYDKAGSNPLTHFKAELPVNVTKRVSNTGFFTAGLYAGFGQLSANNDKFTWGSQFDGYQYNSALGNNEVASLQNKGYVDVGAGITYLTIRKGKDATEVGSPQNILGFSVAHLNRPEYSLYGSGDVLGMRINFYETYYWHFRNSAFSMVPSVMLQYQSKAYEVILGTFLRKMYKEGDASSRGRYIGLGAFYRLQDMCALSCFVELDNYSLGLNYDFNISKLVTSSRSFGGLEISLRMNSPFQYTYKSSGNIQGRSL
jgi:type IX secretion system PorP/SprF family membrane protein